MQQSVTRSHAWLLAARPRTLPAAVAPVLVGSALAFFDGRFAPGPALAALRGALLIQVGANYANDLFDFQKGVDTAERVGPTRVTQAGLLSQREVAWGTAIMFGLAALCGLYLALVSGWPVIGIGVLSILAALAYTGGPYPLGYNGLGEVFVFIFFGLAAVAGTYYVQARSVTLAALASAIPVGCLVVNILVVNNLRDIPTDRATGKRTLAVRFGEAWARNEYMAILGTAYLAPLVMALSGLLSGWVLLSWLSLPLALKVARGVRNDSGRVLNKALGGSGQIELAYCALFALGLVLDKLF
jgi:1,4-dihydroxy-2-naphthoate octaprenyltransferase